MVTAVLPGYSIKNKDWVLETAEKVELSHEVRPVLWDHWMDPESKFNAREKAGFVSDVLLNESVNIIAKSVGTLVASYMIEKKPTQVSKVIFCGIPLNDLDEIDKEVVKQAFRVLPAFRCLCIQNEDDPHGGIKEVREFIKSANPDVKVISKTGDDHEYPYYLDFQNFLKG